MDSILSEGFHGSLALTCPPPLQGAGGGICQGWERPWADTRGFPSWLHHSLPVWSGEGASSALSVALPDQQGPAFAGRGRRRPTHKQISETKWLIIAMTGKKERKERRTEEGRKEGRKEGRTEGRKEGRKEGRNEGITDVEARKRGLVKSDSQKAEGRLSGAWMSRDWPGGSGEASEVQRTARAMVGGRNGHRLQGGREMADVAGVLTGRDRMGTWGQRGQLWGGLVGPVTRSHGDLGPRVL